MEASAYTKMGFSIPATSKTIITIVVCFIGIDTTVGILTLSACLILGLKPDPTLVTAYVGLTSGLTGALIGLLSNTRSTPGTDAEMPKAAIVSDQPTT